MKAYDRQETVQ